MTKPSNIVDIARAEVGTTEFPPNSNNVKYNTDFYKHEVSGNNYSWCCVFVWWVFTKAGMYLSKTASCMNLAQWFKDQGRFYKKDPQVGDVVFFKFNTNSRWTNHVGIVVDVSKDGIGTIEGNTSTSTKGSQDNGGCVAYRIRKSNIVGYGRPNYGNERPTLKLGSKGEYVKELQKLLCKYGFFVDIDSEFGPMTRQAVISYQGANNLYKDGIVGPNTWMKLLKN